MTQRRQALLAVFLFVAVAAHLMSVHAAERSAPLTIQEEELLCERLALLANSGDIGRIGKPAPPSAQLNPFSRVLDLSVDSRDIQVLLQAQDLEAAWLPGYGESPICLFERRHAYHRKLKIENEPELCAQSLVEGNVERIGPALTRIKSDVHDGLRMKCPAGDDHFLWCPEAAAYVDIDNDGVVDKVTRIENNFILMDSGTPENAFLVVNDPRRPIVNGDGELARDAEFPRQYMKAKLGDHFGLYANRTVDEISFVRHQTLGKYYRSGTRTGKLYVRISTPTSIKGVVPVDRIYEIVDGQARIVCEHDVRVVNYPLTRYQKIVALAEQSAVTVWDVALRYSGTKYLELLLSIGHDPNEGVPGMDRSPLDSAIEARREDAVNFLVAAGARRFEASDLPCRRSPITSALVNAGLLSRDEIQSISDICE